MHGCSEVNRKKADILMKSKGYVKISVYLICYLFSLGGGLLASFRIWIKGIQELFVVDKSLIQGIKIIHYCVHLWLGCIKVCEARRTSHETNSLEWFSFQHWKGKSWCKALSHLLTRQSSWDDNTCWAILYRLSFKLVLKYADYHPTKNNLPFLSKKISKLIIQDWTFRVLRPEHSEPQKFAWQQKHNSL